MRERAYAYLETELAQKPPVNESWWPSYTAWQAFAVKVLVEGGTQRRTRTSRGSTAIASGCRCSRSRI